jgi:hypothetical protein
VFVVTNSLRLRFDDRIQQAPASGGMVATADAS